MNTLQDQLEKAGFFADRVNEIVQQYDALNTSIYEFLKKRSSSKFDTLRGKEEVYKLFVGLNNHDSVTMSYFMGKINRLIELSSTPITLRTDTKVLRLRGGTEMGRGHAQSLLAGLYGYGSYRDLQAAATLSNGRVQNLRHGQPALVVEEGVVSFKPATLRAVLSNKKPNENIGKKGFEKTPLMRSKEGMRMGGVLAKDMAWFVRDYGSQFRTAWMQGNRAELRHIAVKRFYGLENANDLAPYLKLRVFPPAFEPKRITVGETQLATYFAATDRRDKKWTALTAFLELKPWCATPEVEKELEAVIGSMARGKPQRFAQIFRRKYGVVMLVLDHDSGIGLITEKGKITTITKLQPKPGKAPRRERAPRVEREEHVDPEDRQPEFHEPPRIVLTSHDPAFQDAFRDLYRRR